MKLTVTNYVFNAAAKTITMTYPTPLLLENILLITNVTRNVIIYNFASSGGTISNNVITLTFDTTVGMSSADSLQIFIDDPVFTPASDKTLNELSNQTILLRKLIKMNESSANVDGNQRQRILVDGFTSTAILPTLSTVTLVSTVTTVNTVSTVSTLSNITAGTLTTLGQLGGVNTYENQIQWSRNLYSNAIRRNLQFS